MGHFCIRIQLTLVGIHEEPIYPLLDKAANLPSISPGELRTIKTHIHHVTLIQALLEKKGSVDAHRSTPQTYPHQQEVH